MNLALTDDTGKRFAIDSNSREGRWTARIWRSDAGEDFQGASCH